MLCADIALVGFGHVARRFALLLEERREWLRREHQLDCRVVGIATLAHGSVFDSAGVDLRQAAAQRAGDTPLGDAGSPGEIITQLGGSGAALRVMIETTTLNISDGQPAIAHVERALDVGCHVVTANKGPVAFRHRAIVERARRNRVSFLFEGAVMDGIPIFNLVRETMPGVRVSGFRGIVNTTTQHILMALEHGQPFGEALARMQAFGIAEADPALDVEGWDAAAKTAALANVLMDADLTPHEIARDALGPATTASVRAAMAAGRKLRLIASANRYDAAVVGSVRLTELEPNDMLATLPSTANAIVFTTDLLGDVAICQMGGDLTQTAYALLSDLVTVGRRAAELR